jgi:hypothetical protein
MAMQLNPEQEKIVGLAIEAGLVRGSEDAVEMGVAAVREKLRARRTSAADSPAMSWSREFDAWFEGHSRGGSLLADQASDRDSIYGERGM